MPKRSYFRGVIDPITIIGVLFLIITAGIGTYVVRNRNINLDINERASCSNTCLQSDFPELCGCTSDNIDDAPAGSGGISVQDEIDEYEEEQQQQNNPPAIQPTTPPTIGCDANGTAYQNGSVVVGGSSSSGYSRCEGNAWVPCPTCTITQLTTVPAYLQEQYNQAVQNILVEQEIAEQTAPRPNDLAIQLSDNQQEQKDICLSDGGMWNSQSMNCTYTTPQQLNEQVQTIQNVRPSGETRCSGSMLETWNGSRWDQTSCSKGCVNGGCVSKIQNFTEVNRDENGTTYNLVTIVRDQNNNVLTSNSIPLQYINNSTIEKVDDGFIRNFTTIVRNQNTNEILNALTQSVHSNPKQPDQPIYNFGYCNKDGASAAEIAECNQRMTGIYNAPLIGRYIQSYANQDIAYNYEQMGYDSISDCVANSTSYTDKQRCNGYQPTKEQSTSSIALGSAMAAGGAVVAAGGGLAAGGYTLLTAGGSQALLAAGATTITQSIALGMAGMSAYQLGTTTDICITEGYTDNCRTQIAWTALSYANIGSSALQSAYQTSRVISGANTFINTINIATDIADISQSCGDGEYASGFGCGAAIVGTVFDVGQGVSDFGLIEAIAKNINFSNVANNPLAEVNFQSPNQLQLGAPDVNMPKGINPNSVIDAVQGPNGTFTVPNTSTTALAVAPHMDIAQADSAITATILDEMPATPPNSPQEIAGLLMAPEQPINVTKDFTEIEMQKVPVEIGDEKLNIPQAENKGFAGIIDEILNPPLAAFKPDIRWLMNLEPPKFIANIGDWVNRNIGDNPIINRIIGKPEDISLSLRPDEAGIYDPTLSRTLDDEQFFNVTDELNALRKDDQVDMSSNQPFDEELTASIDEILTPIRERREIIEDIKKINLTPKQIINAYESGDINEISRISKLLRDNKLDPKAVYKAVVDEYTYLLGVRQADIKANFLEYKNVPSPVKNKLISIIDDQYGINTQGYSMEQIANLRNKYLDIRAELELDGTEVQSPIAANIVNEIVEPAQLQRNTITPLTTRIWNNAVDGLGNLLNPLATRLGLDIQTENLRFTDQAIEGRLSDQAINNRRIPPEWVQRIISPDGDWFPISLLPGTSPYRVLINEVADQIARGTKVDYNLGYDDITKSPLFTRPQYPTALGVISDQNKVVYENSLAIKGSSITPEMLKKEIDDICRQYPDACSLNLFSPTYHGSSSTGLFGLLSNDPTPIKPLSELTDNGGYVFSQSIRNGFLDTGTTSRSGPTGIVSVTAIDPRPAKSYARGVEFDLASAKKYLAETKGEYEAFFNTTINRIRALDIPLEEQDIIIDYLIATKSYDLNNLENVADRVRDILKKYENTPKIELIKTVVLDAKEGLIYRDKHLRTIDLIEKQINAYPNLSGWQRDLLDNSFPVMFGIKPDNGRQPIMMVSSDVDNEMGFVGGFRRSEIQTVFVPKSQIPKLIDLWNNLNPGVDIPFKIEDIGVFDIKTDIEINPAQGFWDGVKKGWDDFVDSKWNPMNWIGGGSPAIDPVADSNTFDDLIKQAEDSISPEYDEAMKHYQDNSPYKPRSASFQPTTEIEKEAFRLIKGDDNIKIQTIGEIIDDNKLRLPVVEEIIQSNSFEEARQILQRHGVEIEISTRAELGGANAQTITPEYILIADDLTSDWPTAKGIIAHESTHTVLSKIKQDHLDEIRSTGDHKKAYEIGQANAKVSEEDWAFANGIRADLYELKNNKNLTPDQITTIQQHIKHSIENYNWVVFGDVLPNRNILSPDIQPVDNGLNIPNTRALGASKFIANADDPGIPYQIKNQVTREINTLEDLEQFFESDNSPRPINLDVSLSNAEFSEPRVEFVPLDLVVGGTEGGKYNDTFLVYPKGQEAETRGREYVLQIAKDYASGRPLDPYAPQEYYKYQGKYYVVDGRHSTAALKALGVTEIPAVVRDIESLNGSVMVTGNIRIPSNSNTPPAGVWDGVKNWLVELDVIAIIDDIPWIPNSVKIALRGTRLVGNNGLDIPNFRTPGYESPPYGMTQQELKELEEWASDTSNGPATIKPEVNENGVIQYPEPVLPIPELAPLPGTKEYDDMVSAALAREKARGTDTIIRRGPSSAPLTIINNAAAPLQIKQRVLLRIAEDVVQTMTPSSTILPASAVNGQVKVQTPNGTKIDPTVDAAFTIKESNLSSVTLTANQPIRIGWRRIKPDVEFTINTNGIIVISPNISMKWSGIKDQFEIIVKENPGFWSKILGLKKVTQIVKLDNQRPSFFYPGDQIVSTSQLKQFPGITTKTIPPRIIAGKQVFYSVTIDRKVSYYPLGEINVLPQSKTNYFVEFGALTEADGKTNWIQLGDLVVDGDTESNYIRLKNTNLNYVTSMIVNNFSNTEIIHQYPNIFESLGQSVLNRLINVGSNNPLRMYLYSPENSFFPVFKGFVEKIDVKNWFGSGSHATDPVAGSDRIINTNVYNGSDLQIIYRSETDQLTPDNLDEIIAQAEAGGIRINREGDFISAGFDRDGTYSLTLPPDSDPLSKLHELIHLDQDLKALQAGISISQLENLPPYNRALYEIQASTETLKYMEKWQIDDDIARIQEEINIEESTKVLNELGEEVPEKITEPWKSIPSNKNVEHLSAFTAPLSPSGFWGGVKNWWEGLKQNDNIIVKFFANLNEKGSLGVPNPFYRNQFVIPLGANHQTELFSHLDTISGNHGEITIQGDTIYYQDTRSTNGSYFRNSPDEQFVKMKRDQIIEVLPNTEIRMADTSPFKVEVQDDGSVVIHNTVKNNLSAKVYEPRITTNSRSIGVNQFLGNKNDRLPTGISWNYDDRSIHQIPTSRISSINTVLLQDVGGGGKSVDDFRKMIRDRTFDTESHLYLNDPVVGYELPDGTIYIESGRHKAQAMIEEGFSEIPMRLYTIKDQKNSGQTLIEFGTILPAVIAVPTTVLYYFDEYFDLGILDRIKEELSGNSVAKSLGAALDSGNFPILKPLEPILPLPETGIENINYNPDIYIDPAETEAELKPQGLTVNKANEDTSCTRIDRSNPCDGERIYQTYLEYKEQFGEITPAEFLAIILMAEASGADPEFLKSITLATSSQLWGSSADHEAYCKTPTCEEGIFNFIGAYTEAGARRYNTILFESDPEKIKELFNLDQSTIDYYKNNGISVEQIANDTVYDPISTVYTNDTPTQWGNFGCGERCEYLGPNWIEEANQKEINTGTTDRCGLYDIVGQEDSLAVVFTDNQKYNWSTKNPDCFKN